MVAVWLGYGDKWKDVREAERPTNVQHQPNESQVQEKANLQSTGKTKKSKCVEMKKSQAKAR